jgi:hypothetical protein
MLVLRGLIWGVSYIQGSGKEARSEDLQTSAADMINETDMMLFLGYLVADESGQHDCLNLVACQQPTRAESYLRSAEMVWKTAKMLDGYDIITFYILTVRSGFIKNSRSNVMLT